MITNHPIKPGPQERKQTEFTKKHPSVPSPLVTGAAERGLQGEKLPNQPPETQLAGEENPLMASWHKPALTPGLKGIDRKKGTDLPPCHPVCKTSTLFRHEGDGK